MDVEKILKEQYGIYVPRERGITIYNGKEIKEIVKDWNNQAFGGCQLETKKLENNKKYFFITTRTGGNNREFYAGNVGQQRLIKNSITNADHDFDNTFASWILELKEKNA